MMIKLTPPPAYFFQGDSQIPGQAWRMCFSSSCAMLVEQLRPGTLQGHGMQPDDYYLQTLRQMRVGDTTEYRAQLATLAKFGIKAEFVTSADFATLEKQLARGVGVPVGWLHHGPVSAPSGGGHWSFVQGIDAVSVHIHDPAGEADLLRGGYVSSAPTAGRDQRYSRRNWGPRWMVGQTKGWAIIASRR